MSAQPPDYPRSDSMRKALQTLIGHNGEGTLDKFGKLCAAGVQIRVEPITWLRLMTLGDIESAGAMRIRITLSGRQAAISKNARAPREMDRRTMRGADGA